MLPLAENLVEVARKAVNDVILPARSDFMCIEPDFAPNLHQDKPIDKKTEDVYRNFLKERYPNIIFVGGDSSPEIVELEEDKTYALNDAIDGTVSYLLGKDTYASSLTIVTMKFGRLNTTAAVVALPAHDEVYVADTQYAYKTNLDNGQPQLFTVKTAKNDELANHVFLRVADANDELPRIIRSAITENGYPPIHGGSPSYAIANILRGEAKLVIVREDDPVNPTGVVGMWDSIGARHILDRAGGVFPSVVPGQELGLMRLAKGFAMSISGLDKTEVNKIAELVKKTAKLHDKSSQFLES